MRIYHDSRNPLYRSPCGAQPCGTQVTLRLCVEGDAPNRVLLRLWYGTEEQIDMSFEAGGLYRADITLPAVPCLLWYDFQIWTDTRFFWYGNAADSLGGEGSLLENKARSYQITVYSADFQTPEWAHSAVFYQIFPDRFARDPEIPAVLPANGILYENWDASLAPIEDSETGNNSAVDYYGGNLRGIESRLPYLASLGVNAVYLNPVFAASSNHRYDAWDYRLIDPLLGSNEDFMRLCEKAKKHNIRIVLDGVFNHTGSRHPKFINAQAFSDSPYRDWYCFENWPSKYKCWWGFVKHPDLNKNNPEVQHEFVTGDHSIVKTWLRNGSSGWRLDVADELPMDFLRKIRTAAKSTDPDSLLLGEVWEDASNKISYGVQRSYCLGDTLDGVMNYPLYEAALDFLSMRIDAEVFKRRMDALYENYPAPFAACLLNIIGSHDRARLINVLAGVEGNELPRLKRGDLSLTKEQRTMGKQLSLCMIALICAMPGMPCLYYGDELAVEGADDPFNRSSFPWGHEDPAHLSSVKEILTRRHRCSALSKGTLVISAITPDLLMIKRTLGFSAAVTLINRSSSPLCWQNITVHGRESVFLEELL